MSLESFIGLDQGEGMPEAAFEAFKEKMKAAAAQIAAIRKEEGKQKKKEEELLKILLKFVKNSSKKELVLLISRVLEQNLPANFILAVILLGNEEILKEVGHFSLLSSGTNQTGQIAGSDAESLSDIVAGGAGKSEKSAQVSSESLHNFPAGRPGGSDETGQSPSGYSQDHSSGSRSPQAGALIFFSQHDETLPLKIKIELDNWIKNLLFQAEENPQKLLRNCYDTEMRELPKEWDFEESKYEKIETIKPVIIQLLTFVMRDFLEQNKLSEPYDKLYDFAKFIISGILSKIREGLDNRKMLK